MTTRRHSKIRFIGYAIPTTPAKLIPIGDPNGAGAVAGCYLGADDLKTDLTARIAVLKNAVDAAKATLPTTDGDDVTNIFVAPEFYFHGPQGPYIYKPGETDPVDVLLTALADAFPIEGYPNWTFVCGTALSAQVDNIQKLYDANATRVRNAVVEALSKQWQAAFGPLNGVIFDMLVNFIKNCHSYPCLEVRNRALIVSNVPAKAFQEKAELRLLTSEKYYVSNEDFLLYEADGNGNVVTEQMTAYPFIDLSNGDLKESAYDQHAIFRQYYGEDNFPQYVDFGVEICLDHSDVRLRRNIDNEPFPLSTDAVHVQLIPSCGMQIQLPSVAADAQGFVFNCDGQYGLDKSNGAPQQGVVKGVDSLYANFINPANSVYAAHTQLARVKTAAIGGDPNRSTSSNAEFETLTAADVAIIPVNPVQDLEKYFAGGAGAVHIYGLTQPFELFPSRD